MGLNKDLLLVIDSAEEEHVQMEEEIGVQGLSHYNLALKLGERRALLGHGIEELELDRGKAALLEEFSNPPPEGAEGAYDSDPESSHPSSSLP